MPDHLTEALRTNRTGGKTVRASSSPRAARRIAFVSMEELRERVSAGRSELVVLDIRERDAYDEGHVPGARHVPRGQLELRIDQVLPDPTVRVVTCCEFGKIYDPRGRHAAHHGLHARGRARRREKAWREAGTRSRRRRSSSPCASDRRRSIRYPRRQRLALVLRSAQRALGSGDRWIDGQSSMRYYCAPRTRGPS